MPRVNNPPWSQDELILALELYLRLNPIKANAEHPEIVKLSGLLNKMHTKNIAVDVNKFRSPNAVYMKLCNFLRFDPHYQGKGLQKGGKLEEAIWNNFADKPKYLRSISAGIIKSIGELTLGDNDEYDEAFPEGRVLYRQHRLHERNRVVIKKVKANAERKNGLACSICGFDFFQKYGKLGKGYIECHHLIPVSEYAKEIVITIKDFVLVCSNCHRMLHRKRPWLSIDELSALIT